MPDDDRASIGTAAPEEWVAVESLLEGAGLPTGGLDAHRETVLVARTDGQAVGCAALELYGSSALLRSVAVEASRRGSGLGGRLTEAALDLGRRHGIRRFYLLTETARTFFPRFGFREVSRDEVDPAVLASEEFRTLCPASSTVMVLEEPGALG